MPPRKVNIAGVPWLDVVVKDVLLLAITFTRIDEVVGKVPSLVISHQRRRAAMPGRIGYLVTIIGRRFVGHVPRSLVGVLDP